MKIAIVYRPESDHAQAVEEYIHEFESRNPDIPLEVLSTETREGSTFAELYGIMEFPTIVAIKDDGQLTKDWQGTPLPLINEVAYYAFL